MPSSGANQLNTPLFGSIVAPLGPPARLKVSVSGGGSMSDAVAVELSVVPRWPFAADDQNRRVVRHTHADGGGRHVGSSMPSLALKVKLRCRESGSGS